MSGVCWGGQCNLLRAPVDPHCAQQFHCFLRYSETNQHEVRSVSSETVLLWRNGVQHGDVSAAGASRRRTFSANAWTVERSHQNSQVLWLHHHNRRFPPALLSGFGFLRPLPLRLWLLLYQKKTCREWTVWHERCTRWLPQRGRRFRDSAGTWNFLIGTCSICYTCW